MKKKDLRVVFMGTPEFAMESLRALVENKYNVIAVVTAPDKPVGRHGSVPQPSPVKTYALSVDLPVLQPVNLKDKEFLADLDDCEANLFIVVAFRMLPEVVWGKPKHGTFNLHASLLPQYRGAAPINWAIINGEKETGVTTFFLTSGMDTGMVIRRRRLMVSETDTAGDVHDALMYMGAKLVTDTVDAIINKQIFAISQEELMEQKDMQLHTAPKLYNETCRINWTLPIKQTYDFIRGLSPYPAAWTELLSKEGERQVFKIYQVERRLTEKQTLPVGTIQTDHKSYAEIAVPDGFIKLLSIQLAGKKRMTIIEFLNGFKDIDTYTVE